MVLFHFYSTYYLSIATVTVTHHTTLRSQPNGSSKHNHFFDNKHCGGTLLKTTTTNLTISQRYHLQSFTQQGAKKGKINS